MNFYVDGACSGNGTENAQGRFAVIEVSDNNEITYTYSEHSLNTTNNREELKAILHVMRYFSIIPENEWDRNIPVVYSDSAYSINTFNDWMFRWAKNDWKKSNGDTPENLDIISEYYELYQRGFRIELEKVKGHSGNEWNEIVDKLAKTGLINAISVEEIKNGMKKIGKINE